MGHLLSDFIDFIVTVYAMAMATPDVFIGTAGYNFSHWRKGVFYPKGKLLCMACFRVDGECSLWGY